MAGCILTGPGDLRVQRSTLAGNTAGIDGGGGFVGFQASLDIVNSTLTGNYAKIPGGRGGGLYADGSAAVRVANSTLTGNYSAAGGGVYNTGGSSGSVSVVNSIVAGNDPGGELADETPATPTSVSSSVVGLPAGVAWNEIFAGGLGDNGGPTQTFALVQSPSNPAWGTGNVNVCAAAPVSGVDQRGVARLADRCDIGAFESGRVLLSAAPTSLGFGEQVVGGSTAVQAVTVTNTGNLPATFGAGSVAVSGSDASQFPIGATTCTGSIAPGATCSVQVAFAPTGAGGRSAQLVLAADAPAALVSVTLSGSGAPAPTGSTTTTLPTTTTTSPSPGSATPPPAIVKVKAKSGRSKLFVDVDPNKGSGHWKFQVQKRKADGTWKPLKTYRTNGSKETRTLNLPKGTYQVVVRAKYGFGETTAGPVTLKR